MMCVCITSGAIGVVCDKLNSILSTLTPVAYKQLACDCGMCVVMTTVILDYLCNVCSALGASRMAELRAIEKFCIDNLPR